jgi:hypothetical protein
LTALPVTSLTAETTVKAALTHWIAGFVIVTTEVDFSVDTDLPATSPRVERMAAATATAAWAGAAKWFRAICKRFFGTEQLKGKTTHKSGTRFRHEAETCHPAGNSDGA